ncbi:hypothetical protein [Chryseobacterium sp. 22543]|uniref:hypothetical protein n=1 Tax=Chryseobacterium sp. 22543 TaxID=3453940 RepID=UPI003F82E2E5
MKNLKFALLAAATFIGLASSYASKNRATFSYGQQADGSYKLLTQPYDPAKCIFAAVNSCGYIVTSNLGSPIAKSVLTAAHATPTLNDGIYIGN